MFNQPPQPGMPSPWLGMQAQMTPEQIMQMQQQQAMQAPQGMMVAQNAPTAMQLKAKSLQQAFKTPVATPPPAPAVPDAPYPGFSQIVTDRLNKIRNK